MDARCLKNGGCEIVAVSVTDNRSILSILTTDQLLHSQADKLAYGSSIPSKERPVDSIKQFMMASEASFSKRTSSTLAVSSCILPSQPWVRLSSKKRDLPSQDSIEGRYTPISIIQ